MFALLKVFKIVLNDPMFFKIANIIYSCLYYVYTIL